MANLPVVSLLTVWILYVLFLMTVLLNIRSIYERANFLAIMVMNHDWRMARPLADRFIKSARYAGSLRGGGKESKKNESENDSQKETTRKKKDAGKDTTEKDNGKKKTRVAIYARISGNYHGLNKSLNNQISKLEEMIRENSDWELADTYSDVKSGAREDRVEFQRMLRDCKDGKIDMIITKDISRFCRNYDVFFSVLKELTDLNVDVFFVTQNIHSIEVDLLNDDNLDIRAAEAEGYSRMSSENQKWRVRYNFLKGMVWSSNMLGYRQEAGTLYKVSEEAGLVENIFKWYLDGEGIENIVIKLKSMSIEIARKINWSKSGINRILTNYLYTGNLILQKAYRDSPMTQKTVDNHGERTMYHHNNTHEPIISLELFYLVQKERERRASIFGDGNRKQIYPYTGLIKCCHCGKKYIRGTRWHTQLHFWKCSTYNSQRKKSCTFSEEIPESALDQLTKEILKTDEIEREDLMNVVSLIEARGNKTLIYHFVDGTEEEFHWKERSRSESWTDEMREEVGRKTRLRNEQKRLGKPVITQTESIMSKEKPKVAAYARVSTYSEEQVNSYLAQIDYFQELIRHNHKEWQNGGVYNDRGQSGSSIEGRYGFQLMISHALAGRIDLILCKSVSRFSRNPDDLMKTIRELRDHGCFCYFMIEKIWTGDVANDQQLLNFGILAEQQIITLKEARSWGKNDQSLASKKLGFGRLFGYTIDDENRIVVDKKEAKYIRYMCHAFMRGLFGEELAESGKNYALKLQLTLRDGIPSLPSMVSILTSEKYGKDPSEGDVGPIIDPMFFEQLQFEMDRRSRFLKGYDRQNPFARRVVCAFCESFCDRGLEDGGFIWKCTKRKCKVHEDVFVSENDIYRYFTSTFAKHFDYFKSKLCEYNDKRIQLMNMAHIENEITQARATIKTLTDQITSDQKTSSDLEDSLKAARETLKSLQNEREQQRRSAANLGGFIYCLNQHTCAPKEFNMEVFNMTVEKIFVGRDPNFSFRFFNGETYTATWDTSDSIRAFMKPERS